MATRLHSVGGGNVLPFDQLAPLLRMVPSLPRPILARLTERMIERLDELDGDPDVEPNGDEHDTCNAEDEGLASDPRTAHRGAGCPYSDPGEFSDEDADPGYN